MKLPLLLVNFKAYSEAIGDDALKMAKLCEVIAEEYGVNIGVVPQDVDIYRITSKVSIPVFAQGIDPIEPGAHTGHKLGEAIKEAGAIGTLINHSENRLTLEEIGKCIKIAKRLGLISVCCIPDESMVEKIVVFKPEFVAYEEPELIGTGRAISKVRPESVRRFAEKVTESGMWPLCGAGISSGEDVRVAIELGAVGVIVASAIVRSKDPRAVLEGMAGALKNSRKV